MHRMTDISQFDQLVSSGSERRCYASSTHPDRLIKLSPKSRMVQTQREVEYFRLLARKGVEASFMPRFYGSFETENEVGFEQERIAGPGIESLSRYLEGADEAKRRQVWQKLLEIKREMVAKNIIVSDLHAGNILIDQASLRMWIVDGYGTPEYIPLPQYIRILGRLKIYRQWKKFKNRAEWSRSLNRPEDQVRF